MELTKHVACDDADDDDSHETPKDRLFTELVEAVYCRLNTDWHIRKQRRIVAAEQEKLDKLLAQSSGKSKENAIVGKFQAMK